MTVLWGKYIRHKRYVFFSIPLVGNIFRICKYLSYARCIQGVAYFLRVTYPAEIMGISRDNLQKSSIYDSVKSGQMFASSIVSLESV